MLLAATTDKVQLVTSAAVTVDVHATYMDLNAGTVTPGRKNTAITTATTTDIVASPAASTYRTVTELTIRNKHASSAVDVTVLYEGSATDADVEMFKVNLLAGQTLEYKEGLGFYVVQSQAKLNVYRYVTADYVNATTSFSDITGLTCPIEAGKHYNFEAHLWHFANATTSGPRFAVNGPAMTEMRIAAIIMESGGVAAAVMNGNVGDVTALDTAVAATTDSSTTLVMSILSGWVNPSAAGTFAIRGASEVAVAAGLTVKKGSWLQLWETPQG